MERFSTNFDKYTRIWSGPKPSHFFDSDCSIGKVLFAFMRNNPTKLCQISDSDGTALTSGEAIVFAIRVAQHLKAWGLRQDDVVGVIGGNTTYLMPVVLGCLLNCTPFHAINPASSEGVVKQLFFVSRPKVIFCDGNIYQNVSVVAKLLKSRVFTLKYHKIDIPKVEDLLEPTKSELYYVPETLNIGGDQTVAILCTSGTTGIPKNVCVSNSACLFDFGFVTGKDILLAFSTIDWSSGIYNILFGCGHGSTRIITDRPYTPEYVLELVDKYKVTILTLTPQQIHALVKHTETTKAILPSVRFVSIGGGNCYVPTLIKIQQILPNGFISYGYALTECGGIAANMGMAKPLSVGKIVPGMRVKILDESGRSLPHGETGEIIVHTGKRWNGYYGNPNETNKCYDFQGWFHTADLGYFDDDNYLYIVERKCDVLNFHGQQYFPHEIEHVIIELPDVLEACVFGLWNEVDGDAAAAAVVKKPNSKLSEQEIVEYVAKRLKAEHKQLHCGVFFLQELPKTGTGKVLRNDTRDMALGKKWDVHRNGNSVASNGW